MSETSIALERVNWKAIIDDFKALDPQLMDTSQLRSHTNALSLAALFVTDLNEALSLHNRAVKLEPLNPLQIYRLALTLMRFGKWQAALELLDQLGGTLPKELVLPQYLRGLCFLKIDQEKRANNIAQEILINNTEFFQAKFLAADASIRQRSKAIANKYAELPKGTIHEGLWADILLKTLVLYPGEESYVEKFITEKRNFPNNNRIIVLVKRCITWQNSALEDFIESFQETKIGSKVEELALLYFYNGLSKRIKDSVNVLNQLVRLHDALPDRPCIRRLLITAITSTLAREAGKNNYSKSLSLNELCLRLEPFNPIHLQNRATLFTLMRERDAYYEAWENLDRLEYRLLLFGLTDERMLRSLVRRHRMFAQQARLSMRRNTDQPILHQGIFKEDKMLDGSLRLSVNQAVLDEDPEQLRQWMYHRQAELIFSHLALGQNPERFLLGFTDEIHSRRKLEALLGLGNALPVLVSGEGDRLQEAIEKFWKSSFNHTSPDYALHALSTDTEVQFLQKSYLDTIGDLTMLCLNWTPRPAYEALVYELLEFLKNLAPFLEAKVLFPSNDENTPHREEVPMGWLWLRHLVMELFDLKALPEHFSFKQQQKVVGELSASLLINTAWEKFNTNRSHDGIIKAIGLFNQAREFSPNKPEVEYFSALCFYHGNYYTEANKAIARFYKIVQDKTSPLFQRVEELQLALKKADPSQNRPFVHTGLVHQTEKDQDNPVIFYSPADEKNEETLRDAIANMPNNFESYENLAQILLGNARWEEAIQVIEQALFNCLSRDGQLKARMMHLEALALQTLPKDTLSSIKLYLNGARQPLRQWLITEFESTKDEPVKQRYEYYYLMGKILLYEGELQNARMQFEAALANCKLQLHYGMLKNLGQNTEKMLIESTLQTVRQFLTEQNYPKALEHITKAMEQVGGPAQLLHDLAEIYLAYLISNYQINTPAQIVMPIFSVAARWNPALQSIIQNTDTSAQCRNLINLANEQYPSDAPKGQKLTEQLNRFEDNLSCVQALENSTVLSQNGDFEAALHALELPGLHSKLPDLPILRQRALLLLKLNRWEEADQLVELIASSTDSSSSHSFFQRYATLKVKLGLQTAQQQLKQNNPHAALDLLARLESTSSEDNLEISFNKAYAYMLLGYQLLNKGINQHELIDNFQKAQDIIDQVLSEARSAKHSRLLELYEKIITEIEKYG